MCFQAYEEALDGYSAVVLVDRAADSRAVVVPGIGCNLIRCRLQGREVIEGPPNLAVLRSRSAEFGVPLLWPPGRIPGGTFVFHGKKYTFPVNEGTNHLHGEIRHLPWQLVTLEANEQEGATVTAEFRFERVDAVFAYYPHPVVLRLTYRLCGRRLSGILEAVNEGDSEAPLGFGLHPYFSFRGDPGQVELAASVDLQYDTTEGGFIRHKPAHTSLCDRLAGGMPLSRLPSDIDHFVFRMNEDRRACSIFRKTEGIRLHFQFDNSFPYLVVFKPKWADAVSLEPWSSISDAFNVPLQPEWTGAAGLKPGERRKFCWTWNVESVESTE